VGTLVVVAAAGAAAAAAAAVVVVVVVVVALVVVKIIAQIEAEISVSILLRSASPFNILTKFRSSY
jgi:hypothetical protein